MRSFGKLSSISALAKPCFATALLVSAALVSYATVAQASSYLFAGSLTCDWIFQETAARRFFFCSQ